MKKNTITLLALMLSSLAFSQVGVNTPDPAATFDIVAKNSTGTTTNVDGLLIPWVDRQRAQSMASVPVSTLVFINDIATGTQAGTAVNIDALGYYYFDGSVWTKLKSDSGTDINIYNSDGTLPENRIVSQEGHTLSFTGTAANAFSVDGSTFSVNASNNRVGINTIDPQSILAVANSTPGGLVDAFSAGINNCGSPCGQGTARNITLFNGNGTNSQFASIDFIPSTTATGITGSAIKGIDRDGSNGYAGLQFYTRNATGFAPRMTIKSAGNIGIGTITPNTSAALEVTATDKGFLPPRLTTAQRDAITPKPAGLMIYNTTLNCMQYWDTATWVGNCSEAPGEGSVTELKCADAVNSGTLTAGTTVPAGVTSEIPYTGGNGGAHNGQTVPSTGVTGLTATLLAGNFANGNGTLTYTITGNPSASGTASFAINIGGKTCTLTRNVESSLAPPKQIRFAHYGTFTIGSDDFVMAPITSQLQSINNYGATGHYQGATGFTFPEVTLDELLNSTGAQLKAKYDIINVGRIQINQTGIDHLKDFANLGGVVIIDLMDEASGTAPLILSEFNVTGSPQFLSQAERAWFTTSATLEFSNVWGNTKGMGNISDQSVRVLTSQLPSGSTVYATESANPANSTIWTPPGYNGRVIIINSDHPFWVPDVIKDALIDTNIEKYYHNLFVYAIEKARGA